MAIAQLSIDIEARLANFERDMQRVASSSEAMAGKLTTAFKGVALATAGLAGVGSFAIFTANIQDAIGSMGDLKDAAERTGASVENLSALKGVAKIAGQDFASVESAIDKLNKALHSTDDESKGAGKAIAALGLDVKKLRDMDPAQALLEIAKAQADFAEGGGKAAAMMAIFGKSGAELTKYMNDLAEQEKLVGKVTTENAKAADDYQKNMAKLSAAWSTLTKQTAAYVVGPAKDITDWMVKVQKESGTLEAILVGLGMTMAKLSGVEINPLKRAENDANDQFSKLAMLRNQLAQEQQTLADGKGLDGLTGGFLAKRKITELEAEITKTERALRSAISLKNKLVSKSSDDSAPKSTALNSETFGAPGKAPADPHANDYSNVIQSLNEKISVQTADLQSIEKLTQAQKDYAKYQADLSSGALVLSASQKVVAQSFWDVYLARNAKNEQEKAAKKADTLVDDYKRGNAIIVERIERERELAMMSDRQRAIAQALYKVEDDGRQTRERIIRDIEDETAQKFALANAEAELAMQRERVTAATAESFDSQRSFESGWSKALNGYSQDATNAAKTAEFAFSSVTQTMEDAMVSFATNTKFTFKDMTQSILRSLAQIAAKQAAMGLLKMATNIAGAYFGGAGSGYGQTAGQAAVGADINSAGMGGFAKGDVFMNSPSLSSYSGQVHDTPKFFQFAAGAGVFAEAGPEAIMPLKRGKDGRLGVASDGGAGGVHINVSVNVDSSGASQGGTTTNGNSSAKALGDLMASTAKSVIVQEMRSGGLLQNVRAA